MVAIQESRKYQSFYTKSTPIVDYMVSQLWLKPDDRIFEPCGGDGVFVEAILDENKAANIDVFELNGTAVQSLNNKFLKYPNVQIKQSDTLLDTDLAFNSAFGGIYDKIIANPPYGAWQDYDKRQILKKQFPNLYAKETYGLFLYRCIELLKEDGLLTFIIPDTFLSLHTHKALRNHILTKTRIKELTLFPSSFFPGVNFGYANLSIITLQKCCKQADCLKSGFKIINNFKTVEQLQDECFKASNSHLYSQESIYKNPDHAFLISENKEIIDTINFAKLKIGDIADCVTGFYSGDDKKFLQVNSSDLKNGKNYDLVNASFINKDYKNRLDILNGIDDEQNFLPIVKGGNIKFLKPEGWFMNWSKEAVTHYKNDKKARFQNPQYYFKFGIGVPMVSSSSITASLIDNKLFDQSIVGVFPKDISLTYYLLGFFNSPTCNSLIRTINTSANNPANYIKKIPFIVPNSIQKAEISSMVTEILEQIKLKGTYSQELEFQINDRFKIIYGF